MCSSLTSFLHGHRSLSSALPTICFSSKPHISTSYLLQCGLFSVFSCGVFCQFSGWFLLFLFCFVLGWFDTYLAVFVGWYEPEVLLLYCHLWCLFHFTDFHEEKLHIKWCVCNLFPEAGILISLLMRNNINWWHTIRKIWLHKIKINLNRTTAKGTSHCWGCWHDEYSASVVCLGQLGERKDL